MSEKELEVKQLTELRTNYFSMIMLISSGLAGLFFANLELSKMLILIFTGVFFDFVFIGKFLNTNDKINKAIKENK